MRFPRGAHDSRHGFGRPRHLAFGLGTASRNASISNSRCKSLRVPQPESERLRALFHESDEAYLKRNPIAAIFRGDLRYANRFGDYCSDAYFASEKAAAQVDLDALAKINRVNLSATDRVAYDVFKYQTERTLAGFVPEIFALQVVRPMNHMDGVQVFYPTFSSGQGAAPFNTLVDYENNLKRHREVTATIDCSIVRFREGLKAGVVDTKFDDSERH